MKAKQKKDKNSFGPKGKFIIVQDFLPSAKELAEMEKKERITINLNENTLNIFKKYASKYDVPYQVMIRNALDKIALNFQIQQ